MILENAIRILSLLPSVDINAPIVCDIRVASLVDEPEYETLSYVWGDERCPGVIQVAGQDRSVTQNLCAALRRLRLKDQPRSLWIDQLCINQWDLTEKAQQVQHMRQIYTSCRQCIVWLGEIPDDITQAEASAGLYFFRWMAGFSNKDGEHIPQPAYLESHEAFKGPTRAIRAMSPDRNVWWRRVWTVQEAALPQTLHIQWGPLSLPWEMMAQAAKTWVTCVPEALERLLNQPRMSLLGNLMAKVIYLGIAKHRSDSALYLVTRWRYREATDSRDKIYALLGLTTSGKLPMVAGCSYDTDAKDVFTTLTIDLILDEGNLIPLIKDPRSDVDVATPNIPRWAMDLAVFPRFETDWYHLYGYSRYNAHGGRELNLDQLRKRATETKETLELRGTRVDTIEWVSEAVHRPLGVGYGDLQIHVNGLRNWRAFAQQHMKLGLPDCHELYPGGYTHKEAFGRTMLGNLVRNYEQQVQRNATSEDVDRFYEYMNTGNPSDISATACGMAANQRFFMTRSGLMGLGHLETKPGDEVWVLYGGRVPFTLRSRQEDGRDAKHYDFVGRSYVQGIMNGEVFKEQGGVWEKEDVRVIILH